MKKRLALFLCLFMVGACSRDSYRAIMKVENSTLHSWSLDYKFLDGIQTKKMTINEDDVFKVDIISEEGELDFKITSDDGTEVYVGTDIPTSSFYVAVDKGGTYEFTVEAHDHKGSLSVKVEEGEGALE